MENIRLAAEDRVGHIGSRIDDIHWYCRCALETAVSNHIQAVRTYGAVALQTEHTLPYEALLSTAH